MSGFLERYTSDLIHFIGNQAGANILSFVAEKVAIQGEIISRITGLNPTRLTGFASFTDSIHTDGKFEKYFKIILTVKLKKKKILESSHEHTGRVAFFVNGGLHPQPNCGGQPPCSLEFALRVYGESIRSFTPIFPSLPCDSWDDFTNHLCNENTPIGNMGLHAQNNLVGSYFLQTNTRQPWTRSTAIPDEL